ESERVQQNMRMLDPQGIVRDGFDLSRGFEDPAFAPSIHDAVFAGQVSQKREGQFEDDRIAVLPSSGVFARIHKAVITIRVPFEPSAGPDEGGGWQFSLLPASPSRLVGVIVE